MYRADPKPVGRDTKPLNTLRNFLGSTMGVSDGDDPVPLTLQFRELEGDFVGQSSRFAASRTCGQEDIPVMKNSVRLFFIEIAILPYKHHQACPMTSMMTSPAMDAINASRSGPISSCATRKDFTCSLSCASCASAITAGS